MRRESMLRRLLPALAGVVLAVDACTALAQSARDCGGVRSVQRAGGKVIGGQVSSIENWPGQVAMRIHNRTNEKSMYFCGGTLVSPRWVLTAAHCVYHQFSSDSEGYLQSFDDYEQLPDYDFVGPAYLEIVAGKANLNNVAGTDGVRVKRIEVHKGYDRLDIHFTELCSGGQCPNRTGNDIALLELERDLPGPFGRLSMQAATDPPTDLRVPAMVAGFGRTDLRNKVIEGFDIYPVRDRSARFAAPSDKLMEVDIPITRQQTCSDAYKDAVIGPGQICAADERGEKDACQGDSGGPLVVFDNNHRCPYQVGITSWGPKSCAAAKGNGVYTRISHHADWIRSIAGPVLEADPDAVIAPQLYGRGKRLFADAVASIAGHLGASGQRLKVRVCSRQKAKGAECADVMSPGGARLDDKERFQLEVESEIAGRIVVVSTTSFGFANVLMHSGQPGAPTIDARKTVPVRPSGQLGGEAWEADLISDRGKLLVFVVADEKADLRPLEAAQRQVGGADALAVLRELERLVGDSIRRDPGNSTKWAYREIDLAIGY